jgi:hypothetical protein
MTKRKYEAGSHVRVSETSLSGPATTGFFEVVSRYDTCGSGAIYRLRSINGGSERMVPEGEMAVARHEAASSGQ